MLTWRWAPCAAFVLGSISFAAFMLLAIPDQIGQVPAEATSNSLRFQLARTQAAPPAQSDWSSDDTTNTASATPRLGERSATRISEPSGFPKRGFSPPLERPEPPPAPAPAAPPPMPPQPQLNVPPPAPPPADQPPAAPPPQREAMPQAPAIPQAQAAPPPADAQAAQAN